MKAVGQAIPIYTMSCFKIPNNVCNKINKICAKFWWGSSDNNKKIHWKSWKSLCCSKDLGGMGFREIQLFNQAILAKLSWRIVKGPSSLLTRTLKGRYFKDRPFLEASLGSNPSLTWRSIMWGRDLFIKGYRWRVGNGRYIDIEKDPWLNRNGIRSPSLIKEVLKGCKVNRLIDERNMWLDDLVRESFNCIDAKDILNTLLGDPNSKDEIISAPDKKGKFYMKSAYHMSISFSSPLEASVSNQRKIKECWKSLWKTNATPKAKIFVLKCLNDILPKDLWF